VFFIDTGTLAASARCGVQSHASLGLLAIARYTWDATKTTRAPSGALFLEGVSVNGAGGVSRKRG
jgi:hypothetical protein